jgi:hypothetical protein
VRRTTFLTLLAAFAVACGGSKPATEQPAPLQSRPLAGLVGQHVVVLPTHYLRPDSIGWAARATRPRETLASLDSAIERALSARGFGANWAFPPALARSARRNAGYVADPYNLAGERLRPLAHTVDNSLREPLATQIRGIIAMNDARFAIFPVELRFESAATGTARPVLRVALLDGRTSTVRWAGDIRGAAGAELDVAMLDSIAASFAELVAAP